VGWLSDSNPGGAPPARAVTRRRARLGKALAPYLLSLPAALWLLVLFLVPERDQDLADGEVLSGAKPDAGDAAVIRDFGVMDGGARVPWISGARVRSEA
jgi:hypothetical protein